MGRAEDTVASPKPLRPPRVRHSDRPRTSHLGLLHVLAGGRCLPCRGSTPSEGTHGPGFRCGARRREAGEATSDPTLLICEMGISKRVAVWGDTGAPQSCGRDAGLRDRHRALNSQSAGPSPSSSAEQSPASLLRAKWEAF